MQALAILWGAVLTGLVCLSLGSLILRDACRDAGVRFVTGGAVLSLLVFLLCSAGIAYLQAFFVIGIAVIVSAIAQLWPGRPRWSWWLIPFAAYFVFYLANAMAPEVSPDGAGYHLGLVARYVREHGFVAITDNFYAAMPGGVEMLFLFAFAFGRAFGRGDGALHVSGGAVLAGLQLRAARRISRRGRERGAAGFRQSGRRHRWRQRV